MCFLHTRSPPEEQPCVASPTPRRDVTQGAGKWPPDPTSFGRAELAVAIQLLGGGDKWGSRGKDHAGQREVSWAAEAAGLAMKEAGQMQNLESEGAGRSVSTQTGSMTGECPESSRHSPFALLCASPAVSLWVPCLAVFACVSAPGCPIPALGASLPRSPESLGPAALAFEVALTTPLYFSSQDLELGSTSLQNPQTVFFIRFQN